MFIRVFGRIHERGFRSRIVSGSAIYISLEELVDVIEVPRLGDGVIVVAVRKLLPNYRLCFAEPE